MHKFSKKEEFPISNSNIAVRQIYFKCVYCGFTKNKKIDILDKSEFDIILRNDKIEKDKKNLKKVKLSDKEIRIGVGRCVNCDAKDFCHLHDFFRCTCNMDEHYINLKEQRKRKINRLNNNE